jgi:Uma2 family endonuclease
MITTKKEATMEDLMLVNGKAELVNGEIKIMPPTGDRPGKAGGRIYTSLDNYERQTKSGIAYPDNVAFRANLPHRGSFSPDASFYTGLRGGMKYLSDPPVFAVEVRSENDYGKKVEREIAAKRDDYFAAGTLVVWDVDLLSEDVIKSYRADDPDNPLIFRRGEMAHAEPALPGWRMPVDDLFD